MAVPVRLHLRDVRPRRRQTGLTGTTLPASALLRLPPGVRPYAAALAGRCPQCAEGALFSGFLKVAPQCPACGTDLSSMDPGDGPAVFVILIGGGLACFGLLFTDVALHPPVWLEAAIWLPLAAMLCLALLRPFKGVLVAAQMVNRAGGAAR